MKIKYQDKEVLETKTFIAPGLGETVIIIGEDNDTITIILDFIEDPKKEQSISVSPTSKQSLKIGLVNWNNVLGTSLMQPMKIGIFKERNLYIMLFASKAGDQGEARVVTLTTYLGQEVKNGAN